MASLANRRRGFSIVYLCVIMLAMIAMASYAVDYARVQIAKTQLKIAADAAALYGITGLNTSVSTAQSRAIAAAGQNKVDGTALTLASSDIEFGLWDPTTRTFTPLSGSERLSATAMRVTARRPTMALMFVQLFGRSSIDIQEQSIAALGENASVNIPATGCPWLAGMPNGSTVKDTTYNHTSTAPANSPTAVTITVTPGQKIYFRDNSGQTGDTSTGHTYGLDGDLSRTNIAQASANRINTTTAPLNALMGIFLNDNKPSSNTMPSAQPNFSTSSARDFTTLSPALQSVFFIGDGMNSSDVLQSFVVPAGATRLYMGVMDQTAYWTDNTGSLNSIVFTGDPRIVK